MPLRRSLVAALAFFDQFDYPLTLSELKRYRFPAGGGEMKEPPLSDVAVAARIPEIGERDGFYFLSGRESIVDVRLRRYRLAEAKFRIASRAARLMRWLPSVRLVAVCNSLAWSNADRDSDIDLFVVVRPGMLWASRLFIVGALAILGGRPSGRQSTDRLCLSFFVTEHAMCLASHAIPGGDPYLACWVASLVPLYDAGGVYRSFWRENSWILRPLPGATAATPPRLRSCVPPPAAVRALLPAMRRIESVARAVQLRAFPAAIRALMNADSRVVVTDDVLKFHINDRRLEFRAAHEKILRERVPHPQPA